MKSILVAGNTGLAGRDRVNQPGVWFANRQLSIS